VLALVLLSPLALRRLSAVRGVPWSRLSDVGQTYGAASALLTGLALLGVVGSMVFQARAIQITRTQAVREQHSHLIEMALSDPVYQRAWGGLYDRYDGFDKYRQHGYLNLIVSFWQDHYMLGETKDDQMRSMFAGLFRGEAGRNFWVETRDMRMQSLPSRRDKRFYYLMESEYQKAIAEGPPAIAALPASQEVPGHQPVISDHVVAREGMTLLLGVMGGIALESFLRPRRH
jgi:uncharacterized protein DUF6082